MSSTMPTKGNTARLNSEATKTQEKEGIRNTRGRKRNLSTKVPENPPGPAKKAKALPITSNEETNAIVSHEETDASTSQLRSTNVVVPPYTLKLANLGQSDPRASSVLPAPSERVYGGFDIKYVMSTIAGDVPQTATVSAAPATSKGKTTRSGKTPKSASRPAVINHTRLDADKAPLSNINEIFSHLAERVVCKGFLESCAKFQDKPLRIVTMCSGTESPILALKLLRKALTEAGFASFEFEHLASAEIEPFKQAYIQRNFDPPVIFRDVRDFMRSDEDPHTIYNGRAPRPEKVHILIAGSSCVDYSTLNSKPKEFGAKGESFATLQGIRAYATQCRPNIVILENVKTAPWKRIQEFWSEADYETRVVQLDTKNFYIPQTRQRGYMIAFDKRRANEIGFDLETGLQDWVTCMEDLQQRATSPFTEFVFAADDPYLEKLQCGAPTGRDTGPNSRSQNWTACRHRYSGFRLANQLGPSRPFTRWQNNGSCIFPDFGWQAWALGQRERIWDTLDINFLSYVAQRDYDMSYKHRWIELSQNVDRDSDKRGWGIVGCLTPCGMPYLTTRGGPVTGREVLALQGLPLVELSLTRETSQQLQDLAGNAMTTTVVAAAIVSAVIAAKSSFLSNFPADAKTSTFNTAKSSEGTTSYLTLDKIMHQPNSVRLKQISVNLGQIVNPQVDEALALAGRTIQLCRCEGFATTTAKSFQNCVQCGQTTCKDCGGNPQHDYQMIAGEKLRLRVAPNEFLTMITTALPMSLDVQGFTLKGVASRTKDLSDTEHLEYETSRNNALQATVCFQGVKRGKYWKVWYGSEVARLELRFFPKLSTKSDDASTMGCQWLLFAKPERSLSTINGARRLLKQPIARMTPRSSFLNGIWEIWNPKCLTTSLKISGSGNLIPSWEQKLGIMGSVFKTQQGFEKLNIQPLDAEFAAAEPVLKQICGTYELLPSCGTAGGNLHRRIEQISTNCEATFLFLDPEPLQDGRFDRFVFASDHGRLAEGEYRPVIAELEEGWRPVEQQMAKAIRCTIVENWSPCTRARLQPGDKHKNVISWTPVRLGGLVNSPLVCHHPAATMFVAKVPLTEFQQQTFQSGRQYHVQLADSPGALNEFHWLLKRAGAIAVSDSWHVVNNVNLPSSQCSFCAPKIPDFEWKAIQKRGSKSKKMIIKPFENRSQAMDYEKAMRARPRVVDSTMHCHVNYALLEVKLNIITIAHQLQAKNSTASSSSNVPASALWRLISGTEISQKMPFMPKVAPSNSTNHLWLSQNAINPNHKASQTPFKPADDGKLRLLWSAQRKTLTWMSQQEQAPPQDWMEQEREEIDIPALGWRLEVELSVARKIKGGILADEVGAGKTTTSLALVAASYNGGTRARPDKYKSGQTTISSAATLILVPVNLIGQWEVEIGKCFSMTQLKLVIISEAKHMISRTIDEICNADIVLASWDLFDKDEYWEIVEDMGSARNMPAKAGRAFQQWLSEALSDLADLVVASEGCTNLPGYWDALDEKKRSATKYNVFEDAAKREDTKSKKAKEKESKEMQLENSSSSGTKDAIPPILHLFKFTRLIVDEFTYLPGRSLLGVLRLEAISRWMLSGTPPLADYDSINTMAKLVGTKISADDERDGIFSFVKDGAAMAKDKTYAEEFQAYETVRSASWLAARNILVERFVNTFVRQNPAELSNISCKDHYHLVKMSAIEKAIYFEVYQILMSKNLKFGRTFTQAVLLGMDRDTRLMAAITRSKSREDALLSCCSDMRISYLTDDTNTSASDIKSKSKDKLKRSKVRKSKNPLKPGKDGKKEREREKIPLGQPMSAEEICQKIIDGKNGAFEATAEALKFALQEAYGYRFAEPAETVEENPHLGIFIENITNDCMGDRDTTDLIKLWMRAAEESPVMPDKLLSRSKKVLSQGNEDNEEEELFTKGIPGKTRRNLPRRRTEMACRAAILNSLAGEIVDHIRGIRLFQTFMEVVKSERLGECSHCQRSAGDLREVYIMGICGHVVHAHCFEDESRLKANPDGCTKEGCGAAALAHHLIRASSFTKQDTTEPTWEGSKMGAVIRKIKEVPTDERILIFVQLSRVKEHLIDSLKAADIGAIDATSHTKARVEKFVKAKCKEQICILQIDSPDAAGWNLHMANHVFFISPLLAGSQFEYKSMMTQAIGRAYRFNQKRNVHVHHFLIAHSIEVNILQERMGKKLVQRPQETTEGGPKGGKKSGRPRQNRFELVRADQMVEGDVGGWEGPSLDGGVEYDEDSDSDDDELGEGEDDDE